MAKVTMEQIIAFRNNGDFFGATNLPLKGAYKLNKIIIFKQSMLP